MLQYKILSASVPIRTNQDTVALGIASIEGKINHAIKEGWKPCGSLVVKDEMHIAVYENGQLNNNYIGMGFFQPMIEE